MTEPKETRVYLYNVTYDPAFLHEFFNVPMDAIEKLDSFYPRLEKDPAGCIPELISLCGEYPGFPQCKNMLAAVYNLSGDAAKAKEINDLILKEHPNYLFAKLSKAYEYLSLNQPEKVVELLGEWMEINELYPERDTFHIGELQAFRKLAFYYYLGIGKYEIAKSQYQAMENIDPDHPDTLDVLQQLKVEEYNRWCKEKYAPAKNKKARKEKFTMRPTKKG